MRAPVVSGLHNAPSAWKANLFYGALFSAVFLPGLFFGGMQALVSGVVGLLILGWFVRLAIATRSAEVMAGPEGIEERTHWGSRRVPWTEIGELRRIDAPREMEKRFHVKTTAQPFARRTSFRSTLVWRVIARNGTEIPFGVSDDLLPRDALERLLIYAERDQGVAVVPGSGSRGRK